MRNSLVNRLFESNPILDNNPHFIFSKNLFNEQEWKEIIYRMEVEYYNRMNNRILMIYNPEYSIISIDYKLTIDIPNDQHIISLKDGNDNSLIFSQFKELYGNNWVSDEVVDIYSQIINEKFKYNRVYIFNPRMIDVIIDSEENLSIFKFIPQDLFENYHVILLPTHLNKTHWVLFIIKIGKDFLRMSYLDPFGNPVGSDTFINAKKFMIKLCQSFSHNHLKIAENFHISNVISNELKIQKNGYDCGPFLCLFLRIVKEQGDFDDQSDCPMEIFSKVKQSSMENFRKLMRKELLNGDYQSCVYTNDGDVLFLLDDLEECGKRLQNILLKKNSSNHQIVSNNNLGY